MYMYFVIEWVKKQMIKSVHTILDCGDCCFRQLKRNPCCFIYQCTLHLNAGQALTGGKLDLEVLLFGVKVHSEAHEICEKTACPISAGKFVLSHTQTLPGITPPVSQNFPDLVVLLFYGQISVESTTDNASQLQFLFCLFKPSCRL